MKKLTGLIATFLLAAVASAGAQEGIKVIGNVTTTPQSISKKDIERVFLKRKKTLPGGQRAVPVDLSGTPQARRQFYEQMLGKSLKDIDSYWQAQVFSGKDSPPPTVANDQAMITFVSKTPGAIGYVSSSAPLTGVKVISVVP